jgi:hypothetical protein
MGSIEDVCLRDVTPHRALNYYKSREGRKQTRRSSYMGENLPELLPEEQFLARECTSC